MTRRKINAIIALSYCVKRGNFKMDRRKISEWMAVVKEKAGLKNSDLARIFGHNDPSRVSKILTCDRNIHIEEYAALVNYLRSNKLIELCLPPVEGAQYEGTDLVEISRIEQEYGRGYNREHYDARMPGAIPELDVTAGAGEGTVGEFIQININGGTMMGHMVVAEWVFPDGYLQNTMKASSQHSVVMEVRGDSMDPTVRHGDKVIIDLRATTFGNDGLYLISDGHRAPQIKRLEYMWKSDPPTVKVISDNPSHRDNQSMTLEELKIVGRVAGRVLAF
jgi:hypothetical protein